MLKIRKHNGTPQLYNLSFKKTHFGLQGIGIIIKTDLRQDRQMMMRGRSEHPGFPSVLLTAAAVYCILNHSFSIGENGKRGRGGGVLRDHIS